MNCVFKNCMSITWISLFTNIYLLQKSATKWVQPGVTEKNNSGVGNASKPSMRESYLTSAGGLWFGWD